MNKDQFDTFLSLTYGTYLPATENSYLQYLSRLPEEVIQRALEIMKTEQLECDQVEEVVYRSLQEYHAARN